MEEASCEDIDLGRPYFVYGQLIGEDEAQLTLPGYDVVGGTLVDGTFVFAVRGAQPDAPFEIFGKHGVVAPAISGIPPGAPGRYFAGRFAKFGSCRAASVQPTT